MAKMTVYHGGYQPVKSRKFGKVATPKISVMVFTVRLLKNRHSDGLNGMKQRLFLSMMYG